MRAIEAWLLAFGPKRRSVFQRHTVFAVGKILCCEPPRNRVMLHLFEYETRRKGRCVAFHHLEVETTHGLHLSQRERVGGVRILKVEIVRSPRLRVAVLVPFGTQRQERVGLVVHEVAANLIGPIPETSWMLVVGRGQQKDRGVDGSST